MIFALVGNQNCGKTTLFNALTGSNQHVGNFPGVTVDQKMGEIIDEKGCSVVDLPGIYSLRPYTQEEIVSRDFILNQKPDGIINIVDATNIERNLYLTMQLMELEIPMVLALNMMDEVRSNGGSVRINELEEILGIPVVPISAARNEGIDELIDHALLAQAYSPMTIRFFILQAHYRSTLDFSNEALQAAEKGLDRLMKAVETLGKLTPSAVSTVEVDDLRERYEEAMNDDLNSPLVIAALFDWVRIINQIYEKQQSITAEDLDRLRVLVHTVVFDVLGLCDEKAAEADDLVTPLVEMLLDVRAEAKAAKNWAASDRIRDRLNEIGIRVKDRKDGCDWEIE